jgi:NAD(P)-dependent dehydrogenase (short-subunit alcohol dehydrogenase family)
VRPVGYCERAARGRGDHRARSSDRGLLNNAGIMQQRATKSAQGWDMTFATNHLGRSR